MGKPRKSIILNENNLLGWSMQNCRQKAIEDFQEIIEIDYTWIQEVLVGIKNSFSSPDVQLCPKTPSAKRTRNAKSRKQQQLESIKENTTQESKKTRPRKAKGGRKRNNANTTTDEELDDTAASAVSVESIDCDPEDSVRSTRSTRSTRATAKKSTGKKNTRSTRSKKTQDTSIEDDETNGPEPVFSLNEEVSQKSTLKVSEKKENPKENNSKRVKHINNFRSNSPEVIIVDTESDSEIPQPPRKRSKTPRSSLNKKTVESSLIHSSSEDNSYIVQKTPTTLLKAVKKTLSDSYTARKSPRNRKTEPSPKTIPNFAVLNVKGKAQAYEEHVLNQSYGERRISGDDDTPKVQKPTNKLLTNVHPSKTSTPNSGKKVNLLSLGKPITRSTPQRTENSFTSVKPKQTEKSINIKRRSSTIAVKKGVRLSLSKRRSSIMRHKVRSETARGIAMSKKTKEIVNETLKSSPEKSPPIQHLDNGKMNTNFKSKHYTTPTKSSEAKDKKANQSPTRPMRGTGSKLKLNKKPEVIAELSSDESNIINSSTDVPHQRTTRSKMRKPPKTPPSLPTPPSEEDYSTPLMSDETDSAPRKSTRSEKRKEQERSPTYLAGESSKRPRTFNEDSDETSPPKRQCTDGWNDHSMIGSGTPSCKSVPKIYRPIKGGNGGRKPVNLNTTAQSFINRNTPKKKTNKEFQDEKRKLLAAKEKEAKSRLMQREEGLQKKREELRKTREERQKKVAKRREEQEKKEKEAKLGIVKKFDSTKDLTSRVLEEKLKEEREKQRQREKKVIEVEQRRKHEDEQRALLLKEKELEQKRHDAMLQRKREYEEQERRQKLEQKKLEEQKRIEMEKELQKEKERLHALEEHRKRKEEADRKEREEKLNKERQERIRIERERHDERERQRKEEYQREKEAERQKLIQQKPQENSKLLTMIEKHNNALHQSNIQNISNQNTSTLNSSKPVGTKMNTSYTVGKPVKEEDKSESYELTPVRQYKKNSHGENYCIDDLRSDDSTDDEDKPRKKIPSWATGAQLKAALINQYYQPPNLDDIFDDIILPDLNKLFVKKRPRFNKRTSSAIWDSPILKPSGALPT